MSKKKIKDFIIVFVILYPLSILFLYFRQDSMVYIPPNVSKINMTVIENFTHQEVVAKDGVAIKGYFIPPSPNKPVILEFHGNGSHPAWEANKFRDLVSKKGYGLLLAEYRGYGSNPGKPNEANLYLDGEAYINWIESNPALKNNPVVIYGASLGSGVAVDIASRHPEIKVVILEVPFNSLFDVAGYHYRFIPFMKYLVTNKFDNTSKIKNVKAPVLIMLARHDAIVPIQFGLSLADAANQPKTVHIFEEASHVDVYNYGAVKVVEDFLNEKFPD